MSQEEGDAERIPLLRGAFHNTNYRLDNNYNHRHGIFSYLGFGFITLATLLLLINLGFYLFESNEEIMSKGISKIPYEYYMGLKSDNWIGFDKLEYVIETSPPIDPIFSNLFDNKDSNFTEESSHDQLKLAEIITKSYKAWNPAYYEVREKRYEPFNTFTVLTTQSYMSGLWFIMWPPKVRVTFSSVANDNSENENNGEIETRFIKYDDQEKILKCDYEIRWNYKYFGEIYRKCPNQENWVKIAYVRGSSELGMQWLDPEGVETYGIVTKPAHGRSRQMRNVVIRPDSPFPPILPALYVAYFDRVIDKGDPDGRTNLLVNKD